MATARGTNLLNDVLDHRCNVETDLKHMGKIESRFAKKLYCTDRLNRYPSLQLSDALEIGTQSIPQFANTDFILHRQFQNNTIKPVP